ncbi:LuxR C-terminal-related transcriptional regulator [Pseudomonas sp. GV071]|uniref:helix-turn-helix transcriptional regulator n=1 Tax=Pseudomonas sp. GV071 TaxID=2135754 RepID=UPI000D42C8AD|nr:LuxR C-terminal-related transcriptional regulator [Pseudomonas sp. GV071]PTQ74161.1 LuxR family transcriptional regulator [Pseudomonas sp. GV071]
MDNGTRTFASAGQLQATNHFPYAAWCSPAATVDERLLDLWDTLDDFGAQQTDAALRYCLGQICAWVGAQDASWVGLTRPLGSRRAANDPLLGWRIGALEHLHPRTETRRKQRNMLEAQCTLDPVLTLKPLVGQSGRYRSSSLRLQLEGEETFQRATRLDRINKQHGIVDRVWAVFPVSMTCESAVYLDSLDPARYFNEQDIQLVGLALRGIKWWHRQLLLSHGLGRESGPLSPAGRRVLSELLSGAPEKSIAERLRITPASAHQYVKTLYRDFGVHGRAEFMSLWISRQR